MRLRAGFASVVHKEGEEECGSGGGEVVVVVLLP